MGTVEFEHVPEKAMMFDPQWADHLVALGQQDRIDSMGRPGRFFTGFYEELPGVSFDTSDVTRMFPGGDFALDKEYLYELDSDVHHFDPVLGAGMVVLFLLASVLLVRWSGRSGWSPFHELAVAGGLLATYGWYGFVQVPSTGGTDPTVDLVGNVIFAGGAVVLLVVAKRRLDAVDVKQ